MTSDLPTLYQACTDCRGQGIIEISDTDGIQCERCSYSPTVMPVTDPLLTCEGAANDPAITEEAYDRGYRAGRLAECPNCGV